MDLIPISPDAIEALGVSFPDELPSRGERDGFLPIQLQRMRDAPERRDWLARLMVSGKDRWAIGHCGFDGPPAALVEWAFSQGESEVYASVAPDNGPSLAVVRSAGFIELGTQVDEVDGL